MLALIGICVVVHLVSAYVLTEDQFLLLLINAAFIPIRYSGQFALDVSAFTSPFTYAFLHGSLAHLAINMIWLAAFGSPLANRLGAAGSCWFWAVTSLAAAALHYVLHMIDQAPLVGASGAISGMMGAAARFGFRIDRSHGRAAFRRAAADRRMPALAQRRDLPGDLDGHQPGDRACRLRARHRRPDRLGGAYRRLPRRLPRHRLVRRARKCLPSFFDEPADELEEPDDGPHAQHEIAAA